MKKDTNSTQSSKPTIFLKKHIVAIIVASLVLFIALAYGIPMLVGDGTGKFTGVEKRVAEETLQETYDMEDHTSRALHKLDLFQYYIEDVWEMPAQEVEQYCRLSDGDDAAGYYYARVSQVTFFGIRIDRGRIGVYEACSTGRMINA